MSPETCTHENVDALDGAAWCEDCGADLDPIDDTDLEAAMSWERSAEGVAVERTRRESPEGRADRDAVRDFLGWC